MAVGMTASLALYQIYRELGIDTSGTDHYYSGEYTVKDVAIAWLHAASQVQKVLRRSDIEHLIVYDESLDIDGNLQVALPDQFYTPLSAFVGTKEVVISPPGALLDRVYWNNANLKDYISMVQSGSKLQLRGNVSASETLDIAYQRTIHPPAWVGNMDYDSGLTDVSESSGATIEYITNMYANGLLFNLDATNKAMYTISASADIKVAISSNPAFTDTSVESVIFALPELPTDYIDPMISLACLFLMDGEDLNGWEKRAMLPGRQPRIHRPGSPRAREVDIFEVS